MRTRSATSAAILVLVAIAVCFYVFVGRGGRAPQAEVNEKEVSRWLVCLDCGHQWTMSLARQHEERMKDPLRFITCPECGARRGVKAWHCQKCGKLMPRVMDATAPDGSPTLVRRYYCDGCAKAMGISPDSPQATAPEEQ